MRESVTARVRCLGLCVVNRGSKWLADPRLWTCIKVSGFGKKEARNVMGEMTEL